MSLSEDQQVTDEPSMPDGGAIASEPALNARRMRPVTRIWLIALIGWSLVMAFYHLEGGAEFEPTDCWVGQTAREMKERGAWLVPWFSDEIRLQKSPGPYWAVLLTSLFTQSEIDKAVTRVPNAIGAVILVLTVFWLTWHVAGDRAAIFAGFATASGALFLYWSHRGASDLGLASLCALSLACLWIGTSRCPPGRKQILLWLAGYFVAGLAMLYKMPMPLVCVGLPALVYVGVTWRWRIFASWWHVVGLLLFLLPWLPWVIAILLKEPTALAKWRLEYFYRFTGDLPNVEEQKHWKAYLIYVIPPLVYTLPYTLSLPGAFARTVRDDERVDRDGMLFMLIWFVSLLAFFTASVGKEMRYFLPALPPLYVLLGVELSDFFDSNRDVPHWKARAGAWAVWILVPTGLLGGLIGLGVWQEHDGRFAWGEVWPPYVVGVTLFAIGACVAAWLYQRRRRELSFAALVVTMWVAWIWIWAQLMPILASEAPFINIAHQLRDKLPAEYRPALKAIGSQDSRIIWYSDVRFPRIIDQLDLLEMQGGDKRDIVVEEQLVAEEMIRQLEADDPVLMVASRPHYVRFMIEAPRRLREQGRTMPETHLWMQTAFGKKYKHFIVFGNKKPPWPEPELTPPSDRLDAARAELARISTSRATTAGAARKQAGSGQGGS